MPQTQSKIRHLLAVGPLPPPPSGSNVSFQVFCDHLTHTTTVDSLTVIDTSPKRIKSNTSILTVKNLRQALRTFTRFWAGLRGVDCAIVFGSNQFLLSLTPLLVLAARLQGKPCFVRAFGGSLDQFSDGLPPVLRRLLHWGFRQSNGLLVETQLLNRHFETILPGNVHHVTAYRPLAQQSELEMITEPDHGDERSPSQSRNSVRLLFISWVRAEKGVRDLLIALQSLSPDEQKRVSLNIYGPVVDAYAAEFERELSKTPSASYGGELENSAVLSTMEAYDVLVFPTYYQGEGYPGVLVEAMSAGIPVLTTRFRSISDMIEDGVNGLLVAPQNPEELADALRSMLEGQIDLEKMGLENKKRQDEYDIRTVLPRMIEQMEAQIP